MLIGYARVSTEDEKLDRGGRGWGRQNACASSIATVEGLTYRELCLIRMVQLATGRSRDGAVAQPLPGQVYQRNRKTVGQHMFPILFEVMDLVRKDMLRTGNQVWLGIDTVDFGALCLQLPYETTLAMLPGLDDIPDAEIENWRSLIFSAEERVSGVPDGSYVIVANSSSTRPREPEGRP